MNRPRLGIVLLLCVAAFLGALAVARASEDGDGSASSTAPKPLATSSPASDDVATIGKAPALPAMKRPRRSSGGEVAAAPAAPAPAASTAPAPEPEPAPAPSPSPAPAPAPAPKPEPDPGQPFLDVD